MGCSTASRNATPPSAAVAPGAEALDPVGFARSFQTNPALGEVMHGFDAPFFQAGLAGYSDTAMRIVARRLGCPMCITEALLDRTLIGGGRGFEKADLGSLHNNVPGGAEDHPLVGQIMGSEPDEMAAAAVNVVWPAVDAVVVVVDVVVVVAVAVVWPAVVAVVALRRLSLCLNSPEH